MIGVRMSESVSPLALRLHGVQEDFTYMKYVVATVVGTQVMEFRV
jgi:hypothetical protein